MNCRERPGTTLLVADGDPSFAASVAESLRSVGDSFSDTISVVTATTPAEVDAAVRDGAADFDGVVVGDELEDPFRTVERLAESVDGPLVFLTDDPGDAETVSAAVDAGVTDYFPRETTAAQYELLAERVADESSPSGFTTGGDVGDVDDSVDIGGLLDGVSDLLTVHDAESGNVVYANDSVCDVLGVDRAALFEADAADGVRFQSGDVVNGPADYVRALVTAETSSPVEVAIDGGDGATLWFEIVATATRVAGEAAYVALGRDVTERKRTERRFRTITERVDEILHFVDADRREVLYANPAFEEVTGESVADFYDDPTTFYDAIHPDDLDAHRAEISAMIADMDARDPADRYDFSFRVVRPDGEVRWLESAVYPIVDDATDTHRYVAMTEDVTDRKERERTLETFHEATRELTSADSRAAACRRAVVAAEETLGFSQVATYLYDEETGALEPSALTASLGDRTADLPSFRPGESLPWQVYIESESVAHPDSEADVYGGETPEPDLVLSLGTHGVMLVGAPETAFDVEEVELAQILAATLEASLNHLAGERVLARRQEQLRTEQARADRLERFNAIIRDIEEATIERSSRAGIEESVCERLVDFAPADLVWVGAPVVGADELDIRTSEGDAPAYVDSLAGELTVGETRHPAGAAYRTGECRAVDNVATDVSGGRWRKLALRHGVQSVVSVPIAHDERVHGVVTIASEDPNAFDEEARDVLAELGRSVGYAVTVAEREHALESGGTSELEFAVDDTGLFVVRASAEADCRVELERAVRRMGGQFSAFYAVAGADPEAVTDLARATPSVDSARVVNTHPDGDGGVVEVTAPSWFGTAFTDHGAVVREAAAESGDGTLVVEAPHGADVRSLVEGFRATYPDTELLAKRQRERTVGSLFELKDVLQEELTERQWEALQTAYSTGYFEWPREITGAEAADLMDVTQPTFNKHLRLAERKAIRLLMERTPRE